MPLLSLLSPTTPSNSSLFHIPLRLLTTSRQTNRDRETDGQYTGLTHNHQITCSSTSTPRVSRPPPPPRTLFSTALCVILLDSIHPRRPKHPMWTVRHTAGPWSYCRLSNETKHLHRVCPALRCPVHLPRISSAVMKTFPLPSIHTSA